MNISTEKIVIGSMVALLAGVVVWMSLSAPKPTSEAAQAKFGACLKDAGVKFYGASWCPHCQRMKKLLGEAAFTPIYKECALPTKDGNFDQTQICKDAKIEGYPTFEFKDGSRITGEKTLKELADKAGCEVPAEYGPQPTVPPAVTPVISPTPDKNGTPKELQPGGASSAK